METNQIVEAVNEVVDSLPVTSSKDKPSVGAIVILALAGIGLGSSVYFVYKGVKFVITKYKDGSFKVKKAEPEKKEEAKKEDQAKEEAPAAAE